MVGNFLWFWYSHYIGNHYCFNHQKQLNICVRLEIEYQCKSAHDNIKYLGMRMIIMLHLQHALLFMLFVVVLPSGQAVHTAAAVSLAAAVW